MFSGSHAPGAPSTAIAARYDREDPLSYIAASHDEASSMQRDPTAPANPGEDWRRSEDWRPTDRVHGVGFAYECHLGFALEERRVAQRVLVDLEAWTDWRRPARRDEPTDDRVVDYAKVNDAIRELVATREWRLAEAMAEGVARLLCLRFPVERVRVKVTKLPFDMPSASAVAVECWRAPADYAEDGPERARGGRP